MSKKTPNISTYFFLSSITKKSNQRIFEVSWHLSFDFESRNLSSILNTMVENHFKKSQFTSTISWVSLNFGVKDQTEERFSRDIQILNETFLAISKYCVMRYFLLSLELNDDCDVDPSLRLLYPWPVAKMSAQVTCNVQPQILGWCMVFAGPLAPFSTMHSV